MSNPGLIERARQMLNAASHRSAQELPRSQQNTKKPKARSAKQITKGNLQPIWMETEASVTSCQREFAKSNRSRIGPTDDIIQFTVAFTYYAHARTYYGSFKSPDSKAPGESFSVFYNALNPRQSVRSVSELEGKVGLSVIGIAGYILVRLLSL